MVVTLRAAEGQSQPNGSSCGGAVNDRLDAVLLLVDAALVVRERLAVKGGGQLLREAAAGQQVARKLFDGESVKRQVVVDSPNHPVAPVLGVRPDLIDLVAVAVGVACQVE